MIVIGIVVFPSVQQLDVTGPYEVFASSPNIDVQLIWKNIEPITSATGLKFWSTAAFADCPQFDILCVPGGAGINALLQDEAVLDFVRQQSLKAKYITSVCTGALILGAAGLLKGKKATTHWNALDLLECFGALVSDERVVVDGNLITAGGVTAGIDFGLTIIEKLLGRDEAEAIQLMLQYAPAPPFSAGTPKGSSSQVQAVARSRISTSRVERENILSSFYGWRPFI